MNGGVGDVLTQVLPLFGVILLAWGAGRWLPWAPKFISGVLVYGLIPILVIDKVLRAEPAELAVIPPMMFAVAALMALPARWLSQRQGDDFDPQLLSASFSFFNVAFFGMPVASALFGEAAVSTIICAFVGTALYGDTIGYYRVARTKEGRAKAASKALRIPLFYAFAVAVILKLSGVQAPPSLRGPADMEGVMAHESRDHRRTRRENASGRLDVPACLSACTPTCLRIAGPLPKALVPPAERY